MCLLDGMVTRGYKSNGELDVKVMVKQNCWSMETYDFQGSGKMGMSRQWDNGLPRNGKQGYQGSSNTKHRTAGGNQIWNFWGHRNMGFPGQWKHGIVGVMETWDFCGMERQQCQGNKKIQGNGDTELPGDGNTRLPGNEDIWYFQGNGNTGLLSQQDCRTVKAMEMLDC